jgi:transcriptional regulator with XRE-family HTH domain
MVTKRNEVLFMSPETTPAKTLGQVLRETRMSKDFTLRKFALEVGISATMMSKIELDEVGFKAGEETLKKIAGLLELKSDYILSLAKKVDSDLQTMIINKPHIMPEFLRTFGNKSDEVLKELIQIQQEKDKQGES